MRISDWSSDVCSSDLRHHAEIVGDQDERKPELLPQVGQHAQNLRLDSDIERRRGLVSDQQLRIAHQRHRDHHALAQSPRELVRVLRSEEHTSELQSLMRISYAVFCLKKKIRQNNMLLIANTTHDAHTHTAPINRTISKTRT